MIPPSDRKLITDHQRLILPHSIYPVIGRASLRTSGEGRAFENIMSRKDSRTYRIWKGMRSRCRIPSATGYKNYGGRGIKVCDRWDDYLAFLQDMGEAPDDYSIDRFPDANGNYEPGNCRWANKREQMLNYRRNVRLEFNGKTQTLDEWTKELGFGKMLISQRIKMGWSIKDALTLPPRFGNFRCKQRNH